MCTIYKLIQICTPNFLTKELKFVLKNPIQEIMLAGKIGQVPTEE